MGNSLIQGTTWHWRQGLRDDPIHTKMGLRDYCKTKELYLPVKNENKVQALKDELKTSNIEINSKRTHSTCDIVPPGSLIVFAATSMNMNNPEEKQNIENLKKYILTHGGKIATPERRESPVRSFFSFFCGGRK